MYAFNKIFSTFHEACMCLVVIICWKLITNLLRISCFPWCISLLFVEETPLDVSDLSGCWDSFGGPRSSIHESLFDDGSSLNSECCLFDYQDSLGYAGIPCHDSLTGFAGLPFQESLMELSWSFVSRLANGVMLIFCARTC